MITSKLFNKNVEKLILNKTRSNQTIENSLEEGNLIFI